MRFPVAAVTQHAGSVDRAADAMEMARSAVREVTMDTQAYGQLCQFLPALLTPIFELAVGAVAESVDALRETSEKLRTAANSSEATDTGSERTILTAGRIQSTPSLVLPL